MGITAPPNSSVPLESDAIPYTVNPAALGLDAFSDFENGVRNQLPNGPEGAPHHWLLHPFSKL